VTSYPIHVRGDTAYAWVHVRELGYDANVRVWLDLETPDVRLGFGELMFVLHGTRRASHFYSPREDGELDNDQREAFANPGRVIGYDRIPAMHPSLIRHLRSQGYDFGSARPIRRPRAVVPPVGIKSRRQYREERHGRT
jgi:hypothetical protein